MRVPSERMVHNGGYLHPLDGKSLPVLPPPKPEPPKINTTKLMAQFQESTPPGALEDFAGKLGVAASALDCLNAAWASQYGAWAFPMRDGYNEPCGVRLRSDTRKWAVTGSRQGIFIPQCEAQSTALICEGPTDVAAALTLGYWAIGRPSCNGGEHEVRIALKRLGVSRAVVVADNDTPGLNGAAKFVSALGVPTVTYVPPCKDLRQFLNLGGTRSLIESSLKSLVWHDHRTTH